MNQLKPHAFAAPVFRAKGTNGIKLLNPSPRKPVPELEVGIRISCSRTGKWGWLLGRHPQHPINTKFSRGKENGTDSLRAPSMKQILCSFLQHITWEVFLFLFLRWVNWDSKVCRSWHLGARWVATSGFLPCSCHMLRRFWLCCPVYSLFILPCLLLNWLRFFFSRFRFISTILWHRGRGVG